MVAGMGHGKRRIETGCVGGDPPDKMVINQIMLRFRPIAPRPVSVESSIGLVPVKAKRAKRKYVRVKKKKKKKVEENNFSDLTVKDGNGWMSLLEEVSNGREFVTDPLRKVVKVPELISFDACADDNRFKWITPAPPSVGLHDVDLAMTVTRGRLVESWITIESVIGTCEDGKLRYTDEEIWKDLDTDTCPGFISNSYDEVQWVNLAYRRMVDPCNPENGGADLPQVVVWLVVKVEKSDFDHWPTFSCRVRVVYDLLSDKKKQITFPCDVWKMDSGGYAWRLDVKAALSLGRLNN